MRRSWGLLASACMLAAAPAEAVFPGRAGAVADNGYHVQAGCHFLHVIDRFSFSCTQGHSYASPEWSADGQWLAFTFDGWVEVVAADGTGRRRVTPGAQPAWSPAGDQIVFARSGDLWRVNTDGSQETRLTTDPASESQPEWSPDGRRIAFIATRDGTPELYTMNAAGNGWRRLTNDPGIETGPQWSPDGGRLLFTRGPTFFINADGTGLEATTGVNGASWSPDGVRLVFPGTWQSLPGAIVSALPDGTDRQLVFWYPPRSGWAGEPRWQPLPTAVPAGLAVDGWDGPASDGDGVLELGETVVVSPAWRNVSSGGLTLSGDAVRFTPHVFPGPVGWTYEILDGGSAYGELAPGASAGCVFNCFALRVQGQPGRHRHVDAALVERVHDGTSGVGTRRWRIHVAQGFRDLPPLSPFAPFVEALVHRFEDSACEGDRFCPRRIVTRGEGARILVGALHGNGAAPPPCGEGAFDDVPPGDPLCPWVEALAIQGAAAGCGPRAYCPSAPLTRGALAALAVATAPGRTGAPPPCTAAPFLDVAPGHVFCAAIHDLAARGIVAGCGGGRFCPGAPVTRQELSAVIVQAHGLGLADLGRD